MKTAQKKLTWKTLTPEQKKRIISLYCDKRLSCKVIGDRLHFSSNTIQRRLKKFGVQLRNRSESHISIYGLKQRNFIRSLYNEGLSCRVIAKKLNISRPAVRQYLRQNDILLRDRSETMLSYFKTLPVEQRTRIIKARYFTSLKVKNVKWSKNQISALEGQILGDAAITKLKYGHIFELGSSSEKFTLFTRDSLPDVLFSKNTPYFKSDNAWELKSRANYVFSKMRKKWYPNDIKIVPHDFKLNRISALHFYLGDGSLYNGQHIILCTDGFQKADVDFLTQQLNAKGFSSYTLKYKRRPTKWRVVIRRSHVQKFLKWLGPCPVPDYDHKWKYKQYAPGWRALTDEQKRYISDLYIKERLSCREIGLRTGFSACAILKFLNLMNVRTRSSIDGQRLWFDKYRFAKNYRIKTNSVV